MYHRKFLTYLFFIGFLLPTFAHGQVPDSIRNALRQLNGEKLQLFHNNLINDLGDTALAVTVKEKLAQSLLEQGLKHKNVQFRAKSAYTAGLLYQHVLDNGAMALYAYEASFKAAEETNNRSEMASSLWQSMSTLAELQLYEEALRYLFQVEAVLQQYNYSGFEAIAQKMLEMGSIFFNTGNYDVAIQYYEKAFSFRDLEKDKRATMYACNTLGLAYQMVQQYDKAVLRFEQSYQLGNEIGDRFWSALAYGNTGAVYFEQGRYNEALTHLLYDIQVSKELGVWNSAANASILVAQIYRQQQKMELAKAYLDTANILDLKNSVWKTRNGIYEQYALLYRDLGDYKSALAAQMAFKALSDTINNDRLLKEQKMQARKHRFEIQNQERLGLEKAQLISSNLKEAQRLTWVFILLSLGLGTGLYFQFNHFQRLGRKKMLNYRKEIEKKELALLRKEIQQYVHVLEELKKQGISLRPFMPNTAYWEDFRHKFDDIHQHFFSRTKSNHPDLSAQDILWLALFKLKFEQAEIELLFDTTEHNWPYDLTRKLGASQGVLVSQLVEKL